MSLLVTGSIGMDTVETPGGRAEEVLGGSSVYFALAAALFGEVRVVGVVGEDFDPALLDPLRERGVRLEGVEFRRGSRTFRWHGKYREDLDARETVSVELNVLAERGAAIPREYLDSRFVFLANTHPGLQGECARRLAGAELIVCDTMSLWIRNEPEELRRTLRAVDGLLLNEGEARLLSGQRGLVAAGRQILRLGPRFVVIKKAEHGSMLVSEDDLFVLPAYPTGRVVDPTGCGDSFAGGMMGYLAAEGRADARTLRAAMGRGSVVASFAIESFSIDGLARASRADVAGRLAELREMTVFS